MVLVSRYGTSQSRILAKKQLLTFMLKIKNHTSSLAVIKVTSTVWKLKSKLDNYDLLLQNLFILFIIRPFWNVWPCCMTSFDCAFMFSVSGASFIVACWAKSHYWKFILYSLWQSLKFRFKSTSKSG